jgi:hypothetical protein
MATTQISDDTLRTAAQVVGEGVFTGSSHLLNGDVREFALHSILGLAARSIWGGPAGLVVGANSLVKAKTGQHIHEHLLRLLPASPSPATPAPTVHEPERTPPSRRSS